ncbi:uncharacterized protein C1orf131 homolog isoform X1 [Emydura macquarii macquarii]|uniref:uncharacterized protein C1orf131 homolog isoform X1 n=1 Tax=Emydura macquarii macquarii TaxID=1129001 RepID=UPI00352B0E67
MGFLGLCRRRRRLHPERPSLPRSRCLAAAGGSSERGRGKGEATRGRRHVGCDGGCLGPKGRSRACVRAACWVGGERGRSPEDEEEEGERPAERARGGGEGGGGRALLPAGRGAQLPVRSRTGEEPLVKNEKKKIQKKNVENKMGSEPTRTVTEDRTACPDSAIPGKRKSASSFFEKLKNELHNDSVNSKESIHPSIPESSSPNAVSPKPTQQGKTTEVEVVTFHGWNKKKKPKLELTQDNVSKTKVAIQEKNVDGQEFNLEKARLEVHKFGITGYEKKEQRILEQERAIMLGAKPPKKEYLNYKIYQQKIKEKKTEKKEDNNREYKSDSIQKKRKKGQEQRKSKKKKSAASILPTGQVGKFTNGTLILRGCDVKKIKSSKVIK